MRLHAVARHAVARHAVVRHAVVLLAALPALALAQTPRPRGRDLGIPFPGTPGPRNAITDVAGVEVGHVTLVRGEGALVPGRGPVRTGVTAILPRGRGSWDFVMAATYNLNGNGDMTGTNWIAESGFLEGPILLTGTHQVGTVRDAAVQWQVARGRDFVFTYPVVAETFDVLSDAKAVHVTQGDVFAALDGARGGAVAEGAVGGGTGMMCNGFKGGIGTSSRVVEALGARYTVGVLVQCNYGQVERLQVLGVPVGRELGAYEACVTLPQSRPFLGGVPACAPDARPARDDAAAAGAAGGDATRRADRRPATGRGSIVVVVATDAPLLPTQLARLARRVPLALGRLGSRADDSSGDLFLAFGTGNAGAAREDAVATLRMLPNAALDPLFDATIDATEEAVVNAMLAAPDVFTGADGLRVRGLPAARVVDALRRAGRMK